MQWLWHSAAIMSTRLTLHLACWNVREIKFGNLNLTARSQFSNVRSRNLIRLHGAPFDAVFSDLGGLNCIPNLTPVIRELPRVLKPGGLVTWVLMPPICLWEMAEIFRGHFRLAFRRLAQRGTRSHLEGLHFDVYYFTPRQVIDMVWR